MTLGGLDPAISTAENYRQWAREARGRSPGYDLLATLVAGDDAILRFLGTLPPPKRQPNLLFAAARYLLGTPPDITTLRALVSENPVALARVMLARRTQTNEPARCATLLPALAQLPSPLALIEVGASAGKSVAQRAGSFVWVRRASITRASAAGFSLTRARSVVMSGGMPSRYLAAAKSRLGWRLADGSVPRKLRIVSSSATSVASESYAGERPRASSAHAR